MGIRIECDQPGLEELLNDSESHCPFLWAEINQQSSKSETKQTGGTGLQSQLLGR